jgi:hypothetical protein
MAMKTKDALVIEVGEVRLFAVLLLILVLSWAVFSSAFRFGRDCERTIGQPAPFGLANEFSDWFRTR